MLKLGRVKIKNIRFGKKTRIDNGVLYVKKRELLEKMLEKDDRITELSVDIARPGRKIRIMPIKDAIEPRVKVYGQIGQGLTITLKGISVITCGQIIGFQEGLLDMAGPGAEYSSFSKLTNVVISARVAPELSHHQHEEAVRLLGIRAAAYLGETAKEIAPEEVEEFEEIFPINGLSRNQLPKVVYIYMALSQGLLHDTYVYGKNSGEFLPVIIQPAKILDGAIMSGNCVSACDKNTTYHHQNNPIIRELYKRHGKELNFAGVILAGELTRLAEKQNSARQVIEFAAYLKADGAVISKEGFGNPDTDLIMICAGLEAKGIQTVCLTDEFAGSDGASQSLADAHQKADAVVSTGNANEIIALPPMKKTIGNSDIIHNLAGGYPKSLKNDGSLEIEIQAVLGATNELGFEKLSAKGV